MTANELLALLGRAWPRLLIYPGGLAAFALIWLITRIDDRRPTTDDRRLTRGRRHETRDTRPEATDNGQRTTDNGQRTIINASFATAPQTQNSNAQRAPESQNSLGWWSVVSGRWSVVGGLEISALALPWLALALLPLPRAAGLSRSIDLIVVLALLEWPLLLTIAAELRAGVAARARAARRLAAALNSYPSLILAALLLASAYGSLDTAALTRTPDANAPARIALLYWLAAGAWLLALPPALGIGAFAAGPPDSRALRLGLWLRRLGLAALAALPWFPLVSRPEVGSQAEADLAWLGLPLPPLIIAALLWAYSRLTAGRSARGWARAYMILDAALLLLLLWAAYTALQARLA